MAKTWLQVQVSAKRLEAEGVAGFTLTAPDGNALPAFTPGAHVDVEIDGGLIRQYSLCNPPHETHSYEIAVLLEPASRGGSRAMHQRIREGDLLRISAPKNLFALHPGKHQSLLFAGGIGITPILCMAGHLARSGDHFELHYCARSKGRAAFADQIRLSDFAAQTHFHFDDGNEEQRLQVSAVLQNADADAHVYVCGPAGFIDHVLGTALNLGWPVERLHREFFAAEVAATSTGGAFEVQIARTGKTIMVPPDQSIVAALSENGIDVPVSCEQGICGTCLTRVLEGEPDHRDSFLTTSEQERNDQMLLCCSRAKSARLVLDL
ncbi:oxidoreductase [Labrenzia suaedae]|uniref:Oxidoreductase n=2 Tax=Roseibium litorale TaxID=2803841 RepID=A0ABR9CNA4_9HYPH|nr:oxidoreductase [Roseibium litorale]